MKPKPQKAIPRFADGLDERYILTDTERRASMPQEELDEINRQNKIKD